MELQQILTKESELEKKIKEAREKAEHEVFVLKEKNEKALQEQSFLSTKEKNDLENDFRQKQKEAEKQAQLEISFALKNLTQKKEKNFNQAVDFIVDLVFKSTF
ncbi:hypothetical protein FJ208_02045 [Candidatus Gribaldobacteria bacterium]|nr:hypothetical protein [Candidatus Gribaldobacteria bacterium]